MSDTFRDTRRESRQDLIGEVVWYHADAVQPLVHDGGLVNLSSAGLNIIIDLAVNVGDILVVRVKGLDNSARPAVVQWCKEISPMIFRVGLLYE